MTATEDDAPPLIDHQRWRNLRRIHTLTKLLLKCGLIIVIAASLNVAVAWGCAVLAQRSTEAITVPSMAEAESLVRLHNLNPPRPPGAMGGRLESWGYLELAIGTVAVGGPSLNATITELQAGWPYKSMRRGRMEWQDQKTWIKHYFGSRRTVSSAFDDNPVLPNEPIWRGFALNTGIYTAALSLLVLGPMTIRRGARWQRGACLGCGYPIGVSAVCTECGRPVRAPQQSVLLPELDNRRPL